MALLSIKSGLIQTVQPSTLRIESYQSDSLGADYITGGENQTANLQIAKLDIDSSPNLPAYDGKAAFGLFIVDEALDGVN